MFRVLVGLITALTAIIPMIAEPCSCITIGSSGEIYLGSYEAAFKGKVVSVRWISLPHDDGSNRLLQAVAIEVSEFWMGQVPPVTVVFSGIGAGDCGFPFELGNTYVVVAKRVPKEYRKTLHTNRDAFWTDICTHTSIAEDAAELVSQLNASKKSTRYQTFEEQH